METIVKFVNYEAFGAIGDGVTDDMEAICAAHAYANLHGLPVKTNPEATYYIGSKAVTAQIETDVEWSTSRFIIDDTVVENNKLHCFHVKSVHEPFELKLQLLTRDQQKLDVTLEDDCYVNVTNDNMRRFIRKGLNQNQGNSQRDCFVVYKDGSIATPIDWNYEEITKAEARPIDTTVLTISGGVFTTIANRAESKYNYYARGINITRSNTVIDGLTHYVTGEVGHGAPYAGFIFFSHCAYITIQNCFLSAHKTYTTIGSTGGRVAMGSYDLNANGVVDFKLINCTMNNINDRTRWGVMASNFCKNILMDRCVLSRLDAHMGVSGTYTIKDSVLGYCGVTAIGRGLLTLDNVVSYGRALVSFRDDYGSTWEGNVLIKDSKWIPSSGDMFTPELFSMKNNEDHNFGYVCHMPQEVEIINLHVDDSNVPEDYEGLYLFADPCDQSNHDESSKKDLSPYPYVACKKVVCHNMSTSSGKKPRISRNLIPFAQTELLIKK